MSEPVILRLKLTNPGNAPSPVIPVQLAMGSRVERITAPGLAPGDTIELPVRFSPERGNGDRMVATVDPDRLSGDAYADNNVARAGPIHLEEHASVEHGGFDVVPSSVRLGQALRVHVSVRNVSVATPLRDAVLILTNAGLGSRRAEVCIALPTLQAQQELTGVVTVHGLASADRTMTAPTMWTLFATVWTADQPTRTPSSVARYQVTP